MDIHEFQNKLSEIKTLAMQNGKQVRAELVEQFFGAEDMDRDKLQKVFEFLEIQGIFVHGYSRETAAKETPKEHLVPLTREEEAYLEEYLEAFGDTEGFNRPELFQKLKSGADVKESMMRSYQKEVVQAAKEFHREDLFLGDLLQEGNMGLLMALEQAVSKEDVHAWIVSEIRSTLRLFAEDQSQQKKEDDILVEKVRNLEARVKELTEDEDVKYSIEELAAFLDMDVEEMESVLRLTGDDK